MRIRIGEIEAGVGWEPQIGDMFYWQNGKDWGIDALTSEDANNNLDEIRDYIDEGFWIFASRLDQLLDEIAGRGYVWKLRSRADGKYFVALFGKNDENYLVQRYWAEADSPDEAAAAALIWILEQEA